MKRFILLEYDNEIKLVFVLSQSSFGYVTSDDTQYHMCTTLTYCDILLGKTIFKEFYKDFQIIEL